MFNVVIEIPVEGINKYEYDKQLHVFRLDRNLYSPVHYPGDYGFIPSTLSDDGDPLDVLVLVDAPSFPGCVMQVRPIGLLEMLDQGVLDEKVLAVGKNNPRYTDVWNYSEIYPHMLKEITHFFSIYKDLEGKRVEIQGWHDAATRAIASCMPFEITRNREKRSLSRWEQRSKPSFIRPRSARTECGCRVRRFTWIARIAVALADDGLQRIGTSISGLRAAILVYWPQPEPERWPRG